MADTAHDKKTQIRGPTPLRFTVILILRLFVTPVEILNKSKENGNTMTLSDVDSKGNKRQPCSAVKRPMPE